MGGDQLSCARSDHLDDLSLSASGASRTSQLQLNGGHGRSLWGRKIAKQNQIAPK